MIDLILKNFLSLETKINKLVVKKKYQGYNLVIARSLFALGLFFHLFFNSDGDLLIFLRNTNENRTLASYSIFNIFNNLFVSRLVCYFIIIWVISGVYIALSSIFQLWMHLSYMISSGTVEGGDQVAFLFSIGFCLISIFDRNICIWKPKKTYTNFYTLCTCFFVNLLLKIQFFGIYFFAAIGKFSNKEWKEGTALYYWLSDNIFGLNPFLKSIIVDVFFKNEFILVLSTWSVLIIELFLAYSIFSKDILLRKSALVLGVIFHFLIGLFMGLWVFFINMTAILIYFNYDTIKKS